MCCQQDIKHFFDNYGGLLSAIGGSIISSIVSIIYWIFFNFQLIKTGDLDINSLILGTDAEKGIFFIAIKEIPK